MVEFALAGSEGLKGKNFSSSPLLTVIVPASGRQERIYLLTKELEEKVARLHLLALGAELTASAMKREDTMQAVDGSVVLLLESCCQRRLRYDFRTDCEADPGHRELYVYRAPISEQQCSLDLQTICLSALRVTSSHTTLLSLALYIVISLSSTISSCSLHHYRY